MTYIKWFRKITSNVTSGPPFFVPVFKKWCSGTMSQSPDRWLNVQFPCCCNLFFTRIPLAPWPESWHHTLEIPGWLAWKQHDPTELKKTSEPPGWEGLAVSHLVFKSNHESRKLAKGNKPLIFFHRMVCWKSKISKKKYPCGCFQK